MENFTPISALMGGALIGLSAALMIMLNGRVAGISGIVGGTLAGRRDDLAWRLAFLVGLIAGAWLLGPAAGLTPAIHLRAGTAALIAGGLLVGFGTRLGGGCTSGHGVCGLARLSVRSLVATGLFMAAAALVVFLARHVIGG
jgi:uncharacterized membrane protein YedE/YeeE